MTKMIGTASAAGFTESTVTHDSRSPDVPARSWVESAVLARVATSDQDALGDLYDQFAQRVFSLARHVCGSDGVAQDVTHAVFLAVWRTAGRFDPTHDSAAAWMLSLTHHTAVETLRDGRAVRRHTGSARDDDGGGDGGRGGSPKPDETGAGPLETDQVHEALLHLSPADRELLAMAYFGGYTYPELAAILDIPLATVGPRTVTAVAHARACPRTPERMPRHP